MTVAAPTAPLTSPVLSSRSTENFRTWVRDALSQLDFRRRNVTFLLGTDEFIHHERRAAFTPRHVSTLRHDLESLGLEPRIFAVAGTGERATNDAGEMFADAAYGAAGAEVVTVSQTAGLGPLDVVHALKEPTEYESELQGPILRIGALHLASKPSGLCRMLARRNFAAILDGGTVGNCSYLAHGGDRTPIVGSMSRFAGAVSGRKVVQGLEQRGHGPGTIIVVGAGIAGMSAIEKVKPKAARLVVIEPYAPAVDRARRDIAALGYENFEILPHLTNEVFDDALGIVFAHRSGAKAAEKVCSHEQIRRMRHGAVIADIAIDQGGSIRHDGYDESDDAAASRDKYRTLLTPDYVYYAETNMPREDPWEASEVHGDSSLPYVMALLALVAHHGTTEAVGQRLLARAIRIFNPSEPLPELGSIDHIAQDLRNGVQLAVNAGDLQITDPDIERNVGLRDWIRACAGS